MKRSVNDCLFLMKWDRVRRCKIQNRTEQNRTEILFGLKHYKLMVTTIHNIQNIYFTHAFKV